MVTLWLPVRRQYFDEIEAGTKVEEFRLFNAYWKKRLIGKHYDRLMITLGYPSADDTDRMVMRKWRGWQIRTINHPHFGSDDVKVFAIRLSGERLPP